MKKYTHLLLFCILFFNYAFGESNAELIKAAMDSKYHLPTSDYFVSSEYTDKSTGVTHVYLQQKFSGIPVYNAMINIAIKNNEIVHMQSQLVDMTKLKGKINKPGITAQAAINASLKHLNIAQDPGMRQIESKDGGNKYSFKADRLSNKPISVELVYTSVKGQVFLSWNVSMDLKGQSHWWNVRVDAGNGNFLDKNDYVVQCAPPPPPASSYRVFPFPVESPTFGSRALLNNPADLSASPYEWHDDNGVAGADYTITRGNNVYSYEDMDNDDLPGYSPDGTASLQFDYPYNFNQQPISNEDAALTNLFYANNAIHDYLYHYGFDEAAGNFQQNNYGHGGVGQDPVLAEGFDGGGFDNANFATPPDGYSGRMQMYLWNGIPCGGFTVNSPAGIAGPMTYAGAGFNPSNATATGNLILVNDGSALPTQGCGPIINNITGKIAVIDRGSCVFITKVLNAQAAGAIGVIIVNFDPNEFSMGGLDPSITIPSVMVSSTNGAILKNAMLSNTVNATITVCPPLNADGNFDNGIIAHEFGHGVSNRLTGGPNNTGCLGNGEQGGEGWSDYFGLIMTIEPGDNGTNPRTMGSYAEGQPNTGSGIRTYPYSTDMNINPHTYGDLALNPEVHYIGEIWCSAIWDMTWDLIALNGWNPSPANLTSGNSIALRLVMEGMKLQPCGPGFLDSRDGILLADHLLYNDAHRCLIWNAFARRGMGGNASQGDPNFAGDETEDFTIPNIRPFATGGGSFCLPANAILDAGSGWLSYSWSSGQTTQTINPTAFGSYTVTVTGVGCSGNIESGSATLVVSPSFTPDVTATPPAVCPHGSSSLFAKADVQVGSGSETNTPGSNPAPYGNWYTANHEQYLIRASELTAAGLLPGNITGLAIDVVANYSGPGSQNLQISMAQTNASSMTTTFINTGFTVVYTSPLFTSVAGWNTHNFIAPFNWNGVSNVVIDISMQNCSTCPASPCVEYYGNDVVHISNTSFPSCAFAINDFDCTIPSFTPDVPVFTLNQRPNIKLFGVSAPSTYLWSPATYLNNTHIANPVAGNVMSTVNYSVTVTKGNGCIGTGTQTVTLITPPPPPSAIQGVFAVCKGQTGMTYCTEPVAGATSYVWTLPSGAIGTSTSECITINFNSKFKGGSICVKAINGCYQSLTTCSTITVLQNKPSKPNAISGLTPICTPGLQTYCIAAVPTASGYNWTITGNGGAAPLTIVNGQGTTCVDVNVPPGYNGNQILNVSASNCKGSSDPRSLNIRKESIPPTPSVISGQASVCKNSTKPYSVNNIPNATTYTWTVTGGAVIQNGQGTKNVNVKFNSASSASAVLSVVAGNVCGTSSASTKTIVVNLLCKTSDEETGITSGTGIETLVTYPNPTSDKLNVTFESTNEDRYVINVIDITGRVIISDSKIAVTGTNEFVLDLSGTAAGTYTLLIRKGESILKQVIVKN